MAENDLSRWIFDQSPIGIAISSPAGNYSAVNSSYARIFGYAPSEMIEENHFYLLYPREERGRERRFLSAFFKRSTEERYERTHLTHDSRKITVDWRVRFVSEDGAPQIIFFAEDVTAQREDKESWRILACTDRLTGVLNMLGFEIRMQAVLSSRERVSLLLIDLDNFKPINDFLGHSSGNLFLRELTKKLQGMIRETDLVRLGGDEFMVILPNTDAQGAESVASRILTVIRNHSITVNGLTFKTTASIGIASIPEHSQGREDLIDCADAAMYQAKESGGDQSKIYRAEKSRKRWTEMIDGALEKGGPALYAQP